MLIKVPIIVGSFDLDKKNMTYNDWSDHLIYFACAEQDTVSKHTNKVDNHSHTHLIKTMCALIT